MSRIDHKRKYVRGYVYISGKSYLSKSSFNALYFMLGIFAFLTSYLFFTAYPEEVGVWGFFASFLFLILGIYATTNRKTILITNGVVNISSYLNFLGVKKIIKVWERPMSYFDSAVVRWDQVSTPSGRFTHGDGTLSLDIKNGPSIAILYFRLNRDGHDLFLDTIQKLENVIGIEIKIKDEDRRRLYLDNR